MRPVSPYAASKAAADLLSYQVTRDPGLDVIRVRPFNHIGPRQPSQYAVGHLRGNSRGSRRDSFRRGWKSATCRPDAI